MKKKRKEVDPEKSFLDKLKGSLTRPSDAHILYDLRRNWLYMLRALEIEEFMDVVLFMKKRVEENNSEMERMLFEYLSKIFVDYLPRIAQGKPVSVRREVNYCYHIRCETRNIAIARAILGRQLYETLNRFIHTHPVNDQTAHEPEIGLATDSGLN